MLYDVKVARNLTGEKAEDGGLTRKTRRQVGKWKKLERKVDILRIIVNKGERKGSKKRSPTPRELPNRTKRLDDSP